MIVEIRQEACVHLQHISYYNNNYYQLPFEVNGCDTVFQSYDGADNFNGNQLGTLVDGEFVAQFYLHTTDEHNTFIFDSKELSDTNRWT